MEGARRGAFLAASVLVLGATAGCGRSELDDDLFVSDPGAGTEPDGTVGTLDDDGGGDGGGSPDAATDGSPHAATDSGTTDDAGNLDGTAPPDAGKADSGILDSGAPQDSAAPHDSGAPQDSGAPADSSVPADGEAQCPVAYAACHAAPTVVPSTQAVCSRDELRNARVQCAAGAHTSGCDTFFASEQMQDPACGLCLSRFDFDFLEFRGIFACVAPFVDVGCNIGTGCLVDCLDRSCGECPDRSSTLDCKLSVSGGTCAPYVEAAKCAEGAFGNGGGFCDPDQYATFGDWLGAVGEHFCGQ